jgi:hypothetical protein
MHLAKIMGLLLFKGLKNKGIETDKARGTSKGVTIPWRFHRGNFRTFLLISPPLRCSFGFSLPAPEKLPGPTAFCYSAGSFSGQVSCLERFGPLSLSEIPASPRGTPGRNPRI